MWDKIFYRVLALGSAKVKRFNKCSCVRPQGEEKKKIETIGGM